MSIHVRLHPASGNATITDMTNAGKRGKKCQEFRFSGCPVDWQWNDRASDAQKLAAQHSSQIMWAIEHLDTEMEFSAAREAIGLLVEDAYGAGVSASLVSITDEDIRGIDAPVPVLTASGDGWKARADNNGVTVDDTRDQNNLPCLITDHRQTKNQAYRLAKKVWNKVCTAGSFSEVWDILMAGGCHMHYYCRMD